MKLIEFYRELFLEAKMTFEPVWEETAVPDGYCWRKRDYPLHEQFQIKANRSGYPTILYSLILPESYLGTTIYEEIKRYPSSSELSLVILNRRIWLNAALPADKLEDSLMGHIHRSRGELMNILDCVVQLPGDIEA